MNQHLQNVLNTILEDKKLSGEEKNVIIKSLKDADKEFEIANFKLDRTEKVKRTTAILLEETIEELEQKRKAVEAQNRELEIESSLERVRTVAMSMNKPDDMVDVCKTISVQLQLLGVKDIRNVQTAIFYVARGTYMNYEYYARHDKTFVTETVYTNHKIAKSFAEKMLKGKGEVFITSIKGREVNDWLDYQKKTNVFIDSFLENAGSLDYYWHSLGPVALGISTYNPLSEEELTLFQRFLKVFDLSYRRYLDIEKAIAQAHEAKIETSLERLRAQAMSMRKSEELSGICEVLFSELQNLGFSELRNTMIDIYHDEQGYLVDYDYSENNGNNITPVSYDSHPVVENHVKRIRSSNDAFSEIVLSGLALEDWREYRKRNGEHDDPRLGNIPALYYYFYSIGTGSIGISTFSSIPEEKINILKRFRNVFDFAYRRYTDVAQAEVQAHEAKIEASLERMRAVAMSMRKSDELITVCESMYKELGILGFSNIRNAQIAVKNEEKQTYIVTEYSDFNKTVLQEGPWNSSPIVKDLYDEMEKSSDAFYQKEFSGKEFEDWRNWRKKISPSIDSRIDEASSMCFYLYSIGVGHVGISTFNAITNEQIEILKRFKKVFELSYQRYIDVAKAEEQTKEARIELALERVRARTMAMQKSEELLETSLELFQQLKELGEPAEQLTIGAIKEEGKVVEVFATLHGMKLLQTYRHDINERFVMHRMVEAWKAKEKTLVIHQDWKELIEYNKYRNKLTQSNMFPVDLKPGDQRFLYVAFYSKGTLGLSSNEPRPKETLELLERFAKVFDQTYTRFLDLQKAEAQAREAQIETSLERVRSKAMAMYNSGDILSTTTVVFAELKKLSIETIRCGIALFSRESRSANVYASTTSTDGELKTLYRTIEMTDHPCQAQQYQSWLNQENYFTELKGDELRSYYRLPFFYSSPSYTPPDIQDESEFGYYIPFSEGLFYAWSTNAYTETEISILSRFKTIIDLTFRRFFDLQKAEAQAREAKIEAALEKVRSRSLAMHKSEEILEVVRAVFERLGDLNIELNTAFIIIFKENSRDTDWWLINKDRNEFSNILVKYADLSILKAMFETKEQGKELFSGTFHAEVKNELFRYLFTQTDFRYAPPERQKFIFESEAVSISMSMTNKTAIQITRHYEKSFSEEENEILKRFTKVFDQSYTRFLDLQKAEAQAREAQIEAALERVRSKTMAMHNSDDVAITVITMFDELIKLGIETMRCGIGIMKKQGQMEVWTAKHGVNGKADLVAGQLDMTKHPLLQGAYNGWVNKHDHFNYELKTREAVTGYYAVINSAPDYPVKYDMGLLPDKIYHNDFYFPDGTLYVFSKERLSEEIHKIFKRFAGVFGQTYRRYLDLQKAEAQAKESQIEAALERVRSRTLAMQKSDELAETAAVLFQQLITLGIEPNRLYIAIVKDDNGNTEFWITDEDGSKVSSAFETNLHDNPTFQKMLDGWRTEQKSLIIDMQGEELQEYFKFLSGIHVPFKGGLTQKRRVQDIAYFGKGFIGMASPEEQPAATLQLLERFAYVFNLTFTRFNDLQVAEVHAIQAEQDLIAIKEAKQKAEETLTELQATQKQLIQSEKMASLGELTAGIAHEIQNPLNFVNNFSEVSKELIDEMNLEIEKGDIEEAKAIANDIKLNLEKINHHGKRADAIVKGMLQHSRATSATKESVDINKLADEYLRLAYHGLRAKDKSFNATFKTHFDETIGNINIIPQDIGRVILNLITNAFYAVDERKKQQKMTFEPSVTLYTRKLNNKVEISVADNGNGIPKNILDKIFQPFFTTKPTGQGTGLGLSLAYDIIKTHGGELKVETKEGEGTTFIIQLPVG